MALLSILFTPNQRLPYLEQVGERVESTSCPGESRLWGSQERCQDCLFLFSAAPFDHSLDFCFYLTNLKIKFTLR